MSNAKSNSSSILGATTITRCATFGALVLALANPVFAADVGNAQSNGDTASAPELSQPQEAPDAPATPRMSNITVQHLTADEKASEGDGDQSEYEYIAVSRPDPFKPFIALKSVAPTDLELTGMQLFEPNQLTLVAVMDTPRGRMAMVEDVTKKGYKIVEGEKIGRRGVVTEIQKDQLLVTEMHTNGVGEEIKTVISMKLKRDGDGK